MAVEYGTNALAGTINLITKSNHREGLQLTATGPVRPSASTNSICRLPTATAKGVTCASINQYYFDGWSPTDALVDGFAPFLADTNPQPSGTPSCSTPAHWWQMETRRLDCARFRCDARDHREPRTPRMPYFEYAFDDGTTQRSPHLSVSSLRSGRHGLEILASYQAYTRQRASAYGLDDP